MVWLERFSLLAICPDLRAFRAAKSQGRRIESSCCTSTLRLPTEPISICSLVHNRFCPGRLVSMLADDWHMLTHGRIIHRLKQVASLRFLFPSAQSNRCPFRSKGNQPSEYPASTFRLRPCGLERHVFYHRRLTSFAPEIMDRDPIMRHRPLSRRRSAIESRKASIWPICSHVFPKERPLRQIGNAPGICLTLRSFNPDLQGEGEFSSHLHAPRAVS